MSRISQDLYSITDVDSALIDDWLEDRIHDIHTCQPAEVIDIVDGSDVDHFNPNDRTVTIRLGVRRDIKGKSKKIAPILYVPVVYPASKNFGMVWPIKVGDTGVAVFSETSIDRWWKSSGNKSVNPRDLRMHDYSDAFFIPHVMQKSTANKCPKIEDDELCIFTNSGDKEVKIKLKDDGTFCIDTDKGSLTDAIAQALIKINASPAVGFAASAEINELLTMLCTDILPV